LFSFCVICSATRVLDRFSRFRGSGPIQPTQEEVEVLFRLGEDTRVDRKAVFNVNLMQQMIAPDQVHPTFVCCYEGLLF
jgi:hypothetical protein